MITWNVFPWFAAASALLWAAGAVAALRSSKYSKTSFLLTCAGLCVYVAFVAGLWISLQRPPLRTQGETRLWYSFFLMLCGALTYRRWHYKWILLLSALLTVVFVAMNLLKPELHDSSLMPALQSYWFVPHVTVYIFSYSVFGCAFLLALASIARHSDRYLPTIDRLVCIGLAFLTLGMLSGSLWAKEAWGYFWSWDPKETWAAVTWFLYLLYLHLRLYRKAGCGWCGTLLLAAGFVCMQMCWYGVNYLPSAQGSMHAYY